MLARLAAGDLVPEGYWLVADRQSAGRGRQGRSWIDAPGNFMGSTVVRLHERDPSPATLSFVAALAEWAIATSVGQENNGQKIVWPKPNPPQWFKTWSGLSPDFLLEADYARQAIVWRIHYSGEKLLGSVFKCSFD